MGFCALQSIPCRVVCSAANTAPTAGLACRWNYGLSSIHAMPGRSSRSMRACWRWHCATSAHAGGWQPDPSASSYCDLALAPVTADEVGALEILRATDLRNALWRRNGASRFPPRSKLWGQLLSSAWGPAFGRGSLRLTKATATGTLRRQARQQSKTVRTAAACRLALASDVRGSPTVPARHVGGTTLPFR